MSSLLGMFWTLFDFYIIFYILKCDIFIFLMASLSLVCPLSLRLAGVVLVVGRKDTQKWKMLELVCRD